jgi:hypothetical protein
MYKKKAADFPAKIQGKNEEDVIIITRPLGSVFSKKNYGGSGTDTGTGTGSGSGTWR